MSWVNAIIQGVLTGGLYALFACGLSLMFGVMKVINLSHGDLAVVAGYIAVGLIAVTSIPSVWSFVLVVPAMAILGYVLQRTLLQAALDRGVLTTLLVTFGLSVVIQNVLLQVYSADTRSIDPGSLVSASLRITGQLSVAYLSVITFVLAIVVLAGLQLFLSRSRVGRMVRASSDDPEAATLQGADPRHIYGVATAIAFATVALAGLMFAMRSSFDPSIGPTRLLFAFEAVVIGGLGSLWGTLIGGMVLGLAQSLGAQFDPAFTLLAGHLIFLAVLAFRPQGLLPARRLA